jgi:DNA-binding transcriptional regulator YhcF (GntR family)
MPESWSAGAGIALDHEGDVPLGTQLDWAFRAAIASGRLQAGERLPGLREVAEQLGVNHNTVRAAVAKLEGEGLLQTRHGAGTFVAPGAAADGRHAALLDETADRARDAGIAPRDLAAALYVTETAAPAALPTAPPDKAALERRALREELAVLDRVLVALEARLPEPLPRAALPPRGPRLLSADELRAQRDDVVRRIADVQRALDAWRDDAAAAAEPEAAPAKRPTAKRVPRPGTAPA